MDPALFALLRAHLASRTTEHAVIMHYSQKSSHPSFFSCLDRVPLGFVCGYPLNGGELYGGSMFIRSAAHDTLQGRAIQAVNEKWGEDFRKWGGRETIGIPVCKKKYSPFSFSIVQAEEDNDTNLNDITNINNQQRKRRPKLEVVVNRMYGCKCHSDLRKTVIERHGLRKGWEPFGQWSMKKAQELARKETERLNQPRPMKLSSPGSETSSGGTTSEDWTSSDDEKVPSNLLPSMCSNGSCTWKVKAKYDNIYAEIHGRSESDDEE